MHPLRDFAEGALTIGLNLGELAGVVLLSLLVCRAFFALVSWSSVRNLGLLVKAIWVGLVWVVYLLTYPIHRPFHWIVAILCGLTYRAQLKRLVRSYPR